MKNPQRYPIHWVSAMFAPLTKEEYADLKTRIENTKQNTAALLWRDKTNGKTWIIDGNHRQKIAQELGRKFKIDVCRNNMTELQLLDMALDSQFTGRGGDSTYSCCEAIHILDVLKSRSIKMTHTDLIQRFSSRLNQTGLTNANTIKRVRPLWFEKLRHGQLVDTGEYKTKSLSVLAKLCKEEEKKMKEKSSNPEFDGTQINDEKSATAAALQQLLEGPVTYARNEGLDDNIIEAVFRRILNK